MGRGVSQALIHKEELKKMGVVMVIETRKIFREAKAGLQDKGDVVIHLKPGPDGSGIQLDIKSKVMALFGSQIRASVLEEIAAYGLTDLIVLVTR